MKYDTTNECAFPCHEPEEMGIREGYFSGGMSLRAYFAGQAMAGLLAGGAIGYAAHGKFAAEATKFADALIEELNR
jgi:hypothetical protein